MNYVIDLCHSCNTRGRIWTNQYGNKPICKVCFDKRVIE